MLLGGILKSIVAQGLEDSDWLQQFCEEPDTLRYALQSLNLDEISTVTEVSLSDMNQVANWFGESDNAAIVYSLDNTVGTIHRDCVESLVDMALLTGNVGKPGTGLYPLRPGMNEQGAWDVGCTPTRLPGGRLWSDPTGKRDVEEYWGATLPAEIGLGVAALLEESHRNSLKSMFVMGDMPHLISEDLLSLDNLDFLVVEDVFLNKIAAKAHVVLPRQAFTEKLGTFTNLERRIQKHEPDLGIENTDVKSEAWIFSELAKRMSILGFDQPTASDVMDELSAIIPDYNGISYKRLEENCIGGDRLLSGLILAGTSSGNTATLEIPKPTQLLYASQQSGGIYWPCDLETESSEILYLNGFPGGKATTITPEFRVPPNILSEEYPLWYIPGRVLFQPEREITIEKNGQLNQIVREELVQIASADAQIQGLAAGDKVLVETTTGRLEGVIYLDDRVPSGTIAVTFLFGQLAVELQTSEESNPMAMMPGLRIQPARLVRV